MKVDVIKAIQSIMKTTLNDYLDLYTSNNSHDINLKHFYRVIIEDEEPIIDVYPSSSILSLGWGIYSGELYYTETEDILNTERFQMNTYIAGDNKEEIGLRRILYDEAICRCFSQNNKLDIPEIVRGCIIRSSDYHNINRSANGLVTGFTMQLEVITMHYDPTII